MTKLRQLYEIYSPQPRATVPAGIRVDDTVFGYATGADPVTGEVRGGLEAQLETALATLEHVIERGGMTWRDVERVEAYASDSDAGRLSTLLGERLGPRTGIERIVVQPAQLGDGQHLRIDVVASRSGRVELQPIRLREDAPPSAIRIGPLLFAFDVSPIDAETGRTHGDETPVQVTTAFDNLDLVLEAAGMRREQLLRVSGFFRDLGEKDELNRKMVASFPDETQKPVHKYVPAGLPYGVQFSLQALGLVSDDRRIIEMEGIRHNDPISLGAVAGNVFVSSRVQGRLEPGAQEQTQRLIEHTRRLMQHVGGGLENVTHLTWGIGDPAYGPVVAAECAKAWPGESAPQLSLVEADFPHSPLPRVEFTALL